MTPNVLIVMSDQHAHSAAGLYGSDVVRTPNLDRLGERGTVFDSAYCNSPICVPSRASMATGRYPHQTGNVDNASPYTGREAPSWGHRLEAAGITAVTFGKLHYRNVSDDTGFSDQRLPLHVRNGTGDLFHALRDQQPRAPQLRAAVIDTRTGESDYTRLDRSVAAEAAAWIGAQRGNDKPWVCHVSFVTPHYPFVVPQEFLDLYDPRTLPLPLRHRPEEWDRHPAPDFYRRSCAFDDVLTDEETRRSLQHYYGLVSFMDAQVGVVLDALEHSGQAGNTLVVYISDHGELMGTDGLWFKGTMGENSVRVPAVLAGPDVPRAKRCRTNVSLVDVFPTVVRTLGLPAAPGDEDLPGSSLCEVARAPDDHERSVFSEYHSANSPAGMFMVRKGPWKYVHGIGFPERLFNLDEDPDEHVDLAGDDAHAEPLERCRDELRAVCDPLAVEEEVRRVQRRRITEFGGVEEVLKMPLMTHSPVDSHH